MSGALSIDWSSRSTSRTNSAAYADATAAHDRELFAAEFTPPPGGDASPLRSFCSTSSGGKGDDESKCVKEGLECHREESVSFDQNWNSGGYEAVPPAAPVGVLQAAPLMYDAVELGGRLLVAADGAGGAEAEAKGEFDAIRQQQEWDGWSGLAAGVEFEGLSGTVSGDRIGSAPIRHDIKIRRSDLYNVIILGGVIMVLRH